MCISGVVVVVVVIIAMESTLPVWVVDDQQMMNGQAMRWTIGCVWMMIVTERHSR